jgi:hypothetical protein
VSNKYKDNFESNQDIMEQAKEAEKMDRQELLKNIEADLPVLPEPYRVVKENPGPYDLNEKHIVIGVQPPKPPPEKGKVQPRPKKEGPLSTYPWLSPGRAQDTSLQHLQRLKSQKATGGSYLMANVLPSPVLISEILPTPALDEEVLRMIDSGLVCLSEHNYEAAMANIR